jgi:hypothetical protein
MSKDKNKNGKNDKKVPAKNLKEKRAEKAAKRADKIAESRSLIDRL